MSEYEGEFWEQYVASLPNYSDSQLLFDLAMELKRHFVSIKNRADLAKFKLKDKKATPEEIEEIIGWLDRISVSVSDASKITHAVSESRHKQTGSEGLLLKVTHIQVQQAEYKDVEALRELYRQEAHCQIIHDATLRRGNADPYVILLNGRLAGYGGVYNKYSPGQLMEFYTLPEMRAFALPMFRELLVVSQATHIEAQTNIPLMLMMLYDCAKNITTEAILFEDAVTTHLPPPNGAVFRHTTPEDEKLIPQQNGEPIGDWLIAANDAIVATGGFLTHYNPPYGDIYMEVTEPARRQGVGSYLVQELKRVCYEAGKKPAARCSPVNTASRLTLQKAGFLPCGRLLVGEVDHST